MGREKEQEQLATDAVRIQARGQKTKTKKCVCCKLDLLLACFSKNNQQKDGLTCYCKKCLKDKKEESKDGEGGKPFVICVGCGSRISKAQYG